MTEQFRAVLSTYSQRTAFQVLTPAVLPMLALSYIMALPLLRDDAERGYLALICPVAVICFTFLGHHLKVQFASFRLRLIPGYAFAHFAVTFLLSLIVALLLAGTAAVYTRTALTITGDLPHVSIAAILGIAWAMVLVAFSAGYFLRPAVLGMLVMLLQIGLMSNRGSQIRFGPPAVLMTLLVDSLVTLALVRRIFGIREDRFEYRVKDETRESQRYRWSRYSDEGWLKRAFWSNGDRVLDRIGRPLPSGFLSQVHHFEAAAGTSQYALAGTTVFLVIVLWAVNFFTGAPASEAGGPLKFFTLLPAIIVFSGTDRVQRKNLQSLFMLPIDREQVVSRYGSALFIVLLKNWLCYAAAGLIVAWMPIPGTIQSIPPVAPLLTSLTAQIPLFGLFSLTVGRSRGVLIGMILLFIPFLALDSFVGPPLLSLAYMFGGAGLIWLSYRRWCQAELS